MYSVSREREEVAELMERIIRCGCCWDMCNSLRHHRALAIMQSIMSQIKTRAQRQAASLTARLMQHGTVKDSEGHVKLMQLSEVNMAHQLSWFHSAA